MRRLKLDEKGIKLISLIASESTQFRTISSMAQNIGLSYEATYLRLKRMKDNGFITKREGIWYLEKKGKDAIGAALSGSNASYQNSDKIYYRIHNIWFTYKLVEPVDAPSILTSHKLEYKPMLEDGKAAAFSFEGTEAKLFGPSIEIHAPDIDAQLGDLLDLKIYDAKRKVDAFIDQIEARTGIRIIRLDKDAFEARLSSLHIALTGHDFAKEINDKNDKLEVRDDEGVLRVIVDKSHGFNEYEAVSRAHAIEDGGKLGKLTKATIDGTFDYEKTNKALERAAVLVEQTAQNEFTHIPLIAEAEKTLKSNNELMAVFLPILKQFVEAQAKPAVKPGIWKRLKDMIKR